jgi:DNA-binding CsgD family transcriptional regulator
LASRSSPRKRSTSTGRATGRRETHETRAADLLLLEGLHARLPIGLLVNDADTLEILHANSALLRFADPELTLDQVVGSRNEDHDPRYRASELASLLEEVAATGRPHHLPEFRHDFLGRGPRWWSASLHRIDTDHWGRVVVTLAVDVTDQVRARDVREERERRRVALQQTIADVPGQNLVSSLQQVAAALVHALPIDAAALRLLDAHGKLHLVAATGLRAAETRRLAIEPITLRQVETMIDGGPHPLVASLGLHWVEIRWLQIRDDRIGTLTIGARTERGLSKVELALLDAAAAQLSNSLEGIERSPRFLRSRSLEMARMTTEDNEAGQARISGLRPRELAILRLYGEGLETHQIAELLVLSVHTVRTHVKNARRRLGVTSRREALDLLQGTDVHRAI